MKSKIRIEHDLIKGESYLQFIIDDTTIPNEQPDMKDAVVRHFIQQASEANLYVYFPPSEIEGGTPNQDYPQIRIDKQECSSAGFKVWGNSEELRDWLSTNDIPHDIIKQEIYLGQNSDPFLVGLEYGIFLQKQTLNPLITEGLPVDKKIDLLKRSVLEILFIISPVSEEDHTLVNAFFEGLRSKTKIISGKAR